MIGELDSHAPSGPLADKWTKFKQNDPGGLGGSTPDFSAGSGSIY